MSEAVHQPPAGPRMKGTVKWFSNKKCFGFITPGEPNAEDDDTAQAEDVFVHQSSIESEGFRTLREGWVVEFTLGTDESGRAKAERVTAPGGGPCTGPPRTSSHRSSGGGGGGGGGDVARDENGGGGEGHSRGSRRSSRNKHRDHDGGARRAPQPFWHESLTDSVKSAMDAKGISTKSGTIDIAVGDARIKLGTGGYSSMAHAGGIVAEGSFECSPDGQATFKWERSIIFQGGQWTNYDAAGSQDLVSSVELALDDVGAVGPDETALTLWGDTPTDPKETLEEKGFLMRRVVLTTPKSNRRGGR